MLGRFKKKKVEGWSIPETSGNRLQRLIGNIRGSNRAWFVCLFGVILLGVFLLHQVGPRDSLNRVHRPVPPHSESGPYLDAEHEKFIKGFYKDMKKRGIPVEVRFVNAGVANLTMLEVSNLDDVTFAAKMLGVGIHNHFGNAAIIHVYAADDAVPPTLKPIADAQWNKRANGFVVTFKRPGARGTETQEFDE